MERHERIAMFNETMKDVPISNEFAEFLVMNGFFTAPASKTYHGAYEGGLFDHSYNVTDALVRLTKDCRLSWGRPESPYIIGMFHDLCKIESYQKDKEDPTRYQNKDKSNQLYTGHGEKSVLLLAPWIQLTPEEIACIRWHMGAFDDKENWNHYTAAIHQFPSVLWAHHADMIAAHIWEVAHD